MKLTEMNLMDGKSENISMTYLRGCPGDVFSQVQMGKTFNVMKNGKVIAVISKPELNAFELGAACRKAGVVK